MRLYQPGRIVRIIGHSSDRDGDGVAAEERIPGVLHPSFKLLPEFRFDPLQIGIVSPVVGFVWIKNQIVKDFLIVFVLAPTLGE
jgi:hypothetical protein